ncbi:MAG: 2-hydroxyacyl-CoA dehydratase [Deltaproteobacteria bacterium HGW-Deltaproteobacteria-6]|nr:MAG: 2-hydroxyacyl-CoA dehydratase [Deltaproteobacteria bacterium HGW-Deltaproteobacteria-6]
MNHLEEYRQAVSEPAGYARQLKKASGKKIIGYTCSYTPEEVIMAGGAHPLRLFGTKQNISLADSHLQSYCCSVVRGILEEGLSGRVDYLSGMVFPHTCDSMQRLSDIWRMNIPFGFHLDITLPVKLDTASARDYMADVLKKFADDLGRKLEVEISDEALQKAITTTNTIRQSIRSIYDMRSLYPQLLPGEDLYNIVRASMIMDRDRLAILLAETAAELKERAAGAKPAAVKRILLAGGMCNQPDVYAMIEESGGGIVWDDFCTGARYFTGLTDTGRDPLSGIGERLLNRVVCPAKHADLDGRARHIIGLVKEKNVRGVIFLLFKFCDPHAFDYPYLKERLDEAGIPLMIAEVDDSLPAGGQLKTRFEAFLEML